MRVTVGTIVGLVASGASFEEILRFYPYLESEDIRAAVVICRSSDALRFVLRPDTPKIAAQGGCSLRFRLVILLDLHLMARPLRLLVRRRRKKLYIDGFRHRLVTRPVGVQQLPRASSRVVRLHGRFHGAGSRIQRRCIKICHGIK
jgi:hypothetical protein